MDKKSRLLFTVFFLLIIGSIALTYYRYFVVRDYIIEAQVDCDPNYERCFTYVCDPEAGEECTGRPEEDTSYYKLIYRNAKHIPLCNPMEEGCEVSVCPPNEEDCEITFCDPLTAEEGVICTDPDAYLLQNTKTEDASESAADEENVIPTADIEIKSEGAATDPSE